MMFGFVALRGLATAISTVAAKTAVGHNRCFSIRRFPVSPARDPPSPPFVSAAIVAETDPRRAGEWRHTEREPTDPIGPPPTRQGGPNRVKAMRAP